MDYCIRWSCGNDFIKHVEFGLIPFVEDLASLNGLLGCNTSYSIVNKSHSTMLDHFNLANRYLQLGQGLSD